MTYIVVKDVIVMMEHVVFSLCLLHSYVFTLICLKVQIHVVK
jgi:hypothetical protein